MAGIKLRRPDDFHVHFRRADMLRTVVPYTARHFGRALVMPNTDPPILTADDVVAYRAEIAAAVPEGCAFSPLMTIKITDATTPETIRAAHAVGAIAGKAYPVGVTTGAEQGVTDFYALPDVWVEMEQQGMVLCLHGEQPGVFCLDRETEFLHVVRDLAARYPRLRIVLEHITTAEAVDQVHGFPDNVAATITPHHLIFTLDDVIGGKLAPHHFCKPIPKRPEDRAELVKAATGREERNSKFFLGTDSAPHPRARKECGAGEAGIFSAPVAMPLLWQIFIRARSGPEVLGDFVAGRGADFYRLPRSEGKITLVREAWTVPSEIGGLVPLCAGHELAWRVKE